MDLGGSRQCYSGNATRFFMRIQQIRAPRLLFGTGVSTQAGFLKEQELAEHAPRPMEAAAEDTDPSGVTGGVRN
jgi:hypothetical protein